MNLQDFKYIIVDEYQDISRQRFDLTKELSEVTDAKIIAVGDDWQSIYAFSGSDITLFTKFEEKMGYAKMLKIVRTYRNSQEVIDIAGNFIQQNKEQISKQLISNKHITDPVLIYTYDSSPKKANNANRKSGSNYEMAHAIEQVLGDLLLYKKEEGKEPGSILLLGRYGFDGDNLERTGLFEYINRTNKVKSVKYPRLDITFMTAHSSKGLGYDDVIVINGKNETYGFPSKVEDDPVLSFVIKGDRSIDYAEERRLFYVAMTRTKNRVFFVAPEKNPSEFLLELKRTYKNVKLLGEWNEEEPISIAKKPCPICGYPMQYKYKKAYGLRLYICTNEPELCGFMTNDYRAGKLSIQKCDKCRDGYLIIKKGKADDYFLGCTNYKFNNCGCNNMVSRLAYYAQMGYNLFEDRPETINTEEVEATANVNVTVGFNNASDSKTAAKAFSTSKEPNIGFERPLVRQSSQENADSVKQEHSYDINEIKRDSKEDDYVEIVRANVKPVLYKNVNLNTIVFNVVSALQNISKTRFFGTMILCDVLRGSNNKRIIEYKLNLVPEYGIYKKFSGEIIHSIIEWMISEHYILQTKGLYPVLHSTYEGLHYSETITEGKLKKLKTKLETEFPVVVSEKVNKKGKGNYYLTYEDAKGFKYSKLYYISDICDELNRITSAENVKKIKYKIVWEYLLSCGYVEEINEDGKMNKVQTSLGFQKGIQMIEKISQKGYPYKILMYPEIIQREIVEHYIK